MKKTMKRLWHDMVQKLRKDRRIFCISAGFSLVIIVFTYLFGNTRHSLPGDNAALLEISYAKKYLGMKSDNVPDSLLLINVCYDKQLIPFEEEGMPVGDVVITDREKLLRFLTIAKEADNYRYIFLDINFEEGFDTPVDSALFATIKSMDRILIPKHQGIRMKDSTLHAKSANADYSITWKVRMFSRFQFLRNDTVVTVPLRMYSERIGADGCAITPHLGGLWYSDNGRLCHNGVTLLMRMVVNGRLADDEGQSRAYNYSYLGADLLDVDEVFPVREQLADKIVVIGDFELDRHTTYAGAQPGSVVCMNAYLALMEGDHLVNWLNVLLLFLVYTVVGTFYLQGNSFSSLFSNPWLSVLMSFLSTATLFLVISLIANWNDIVFNIWVPTTVYSLIDTYVQKRKLFKTRKNEKNSNPAVA